MPANPNYPGVYLDEIPCGARSIAGVTTSVAAFAGAAARGPVDEAVHIASFADFERRFGGLAAASEMSYGVRQFFQNGGTDAWVVRIVKSATPASLVLKNDVGDDVLRVTALDPGLAGNDIQLRVARAVDGSAFDLTLIRHTDQLTETYRDLSMKSSDPRYALDLVNGVSHLVALERLVGAAVLASLPVGTSTRATLALGTEVPYAAADVYPSFIADRSGRKGIYALESVDLFNLLVLPGITDPGTLAAAAAYCEERRAFLIVDAPPASTTPDQMVKVVRGTDLPKSDHAAVYYPWIAIADPLENGKPRSTAPSGSIAGLYARTDAARGVWKAPAGAEASVKGVLALGYTLTDRENGTLNPLAVNCIRSFPTYGVVAWGARTLQGADQVNSEYKYVPIRRLALYIEESLYRGSEWVVFEPNDEPLWAQIRLNFGAFLEGLFRRGAFQGSTPRDAYLVKCDRETTTQDDIDRGVVNILIGFAPLKPAEFVIIRIKQLAGQVRA